MPMDEKNYIRTKSGEMMTEEVSLRRIIADYERRLTEAADLVAHVRHEINNPLTGIMGQAQLMLREELSESVRRRVVTIEHLAGRIRDTVAELRDIQPPIPQSTAPDSTSAKSPQDGEDRQTNTPLPPS